MQKKKKINAMIYKSNQTIFYQNGKVFPAVSRPPCSKSLNI